MAQWVKALATKLDNQCLIPGTHMVPHVRKELSPSGCTVTSLDRMARAHPTHK